MDFSQITQQVTVDLDRALKEIQVDQIEDFITRIKTTKRVFVYGLGRERLVLQAFAMRLMHLGFDVHVVGDVTTPRIGKDDLFVTSSGTGYLSTVAALMPIAKEAGANIALVTAAADSPLLEHVDTCVLISVKTMRDDPSAQSSIQPLGALFEQTMYLMLDSIVLRLKQSMNITDESMTEFHTNLE
ncbi:6-phospho-3-hexuloisomerase [Alicyclobacillus dauci]|uniref:SIS domain-containing protein n=1 Tax=Alicyclobacillus dauci TaxID=1475485 RepID=A0ABY6Z5C5_9BACL|nr:6-phospho-3-hexuloisomerase [Alicyclobacillus dauci]WAH37959.1 SIS domain-containing protein [Alicyclobacillus dauci]